MKPTETTPDPQGDLFLIELDRIIDSSHPLVRLGHEVDWKRLGEIFGETYCEDNGRPATCIRLMIALQYLKFTFDLSDEQVCDGWVENPYWQAFGGNQYFEHRRPKQLFIAADGPRLDKQGEAERCQTTREIIVQVDWECDVKTLFREQNLGCREAVSSAITWFFEHVEQGIILEDDCLPSASFFSYCTELLGRYAADERVMMISGDNFQEGIQRGTASYYFSQIPHIWGWATWRRAWIQYDVRMASFPEFLKMGGIERISTKIDVQNFWLNVFINTYNSGVCTWDYQWVYAILSRGGLCICPQVNMITNIGFGADSTNTSDASSRQACMKRYDIEEVVHPCFLGEEIFANHDADMHVYQTIYDVSLNSRSMEISLFRWRKLIRKRWKTLQLVKAFLREQSKREIR